MRKVVVALAFTVGLLCGCAQHYVMKLNNGLVVRTNSKPHLQGAYYHYKDAQGKDAFVPQSRVAEIEPASQAKEEEKFTPSYPKPKTHWWQFWR
jgi:hypothetical protein